jgi:hypothetical protein
MAHSLHTLPDSRQVCRLPLAPVKVEMH